MIRTVDLGISEIVMIGETLSLELFPQNIGLQEEAVPVELFIDGMRTECGYNISCMAVDSRIG